MYQLQETLFGESESSNFHYSDDQKLFRNIVVFDFRSICVQEDKSCDTETTNWIGALFPISLSISSYLIEQPIVLCKSNPAALVGSFVDALDGLATQSKMQLKIKFLEIETSVNSKLNQVLSS